jgi:GT2 family glycosyltransferase
MLVKRATVEAAGLWDPLYHLSVEDADFCMRARRAGWRCFFAHRARLWHMVSVTAGGYRPARTYQTGRSSAIFVRRYATLWQRLSVLAFLAVGMPAAFLRELPRRNTAAVVAKVRGFLAGLREPLPPPPAVQAPAPTPTPPEAVERSAAGAR